MQQLKIFDAQDFPIYLPKLNELYDDLFAGGKGFRAKLTKRIADAIELSTSTTQLLCQTIEFVHNASLLHDDLIDRSVLRREKTAAWLKYTPEYAVLAGDYLLARVMVNLSRHGNLPVIQLTSEVISDLLEGEWIQDSLVNDWSLQFGQLDRVHRLKTGSLFSWCIRAPFLAKDMNQPELHEILTELGVTLGLLFQRSDDLLDFDIRNIEKKAVLGDLHSGYLNSFAVFLLDGYSVEEKKKLARLQTIQEFRKEYGEEKFNLRLESFDQMNSRLIELYHHRLEQVQQMLPLQGAKLQTSLREVAKILYWRNIS